MKKRIGSQTLRTLVIASVAAVSFVGAAQSIEPAQAMPVAAPSATQGSVTTGVAPAAYRRYYRYGRYYGYRRAVPCRGGMRTHLSKRYC